MGRPTKEERTERDLLLEKCVYAGLTINQMSALSQTWKYPMQRQHVGRRLKQLGLRKRVKSVQLPHEQGIIEFLIRFEADYWDKEYSAGCGVRADLFLTRKCKTYFYEYQASAFRNKLRQKIRGYVALHKLSEPFRTLFHFRNKIELETAVRMANEEIDTEAEIFLFSSDGQNWTNRWGREKLIE